MYLRPDIPIIILGSFPPVPVLKGYSTGAEHSLFTSCLVDQIPEARFPRRPLLGNRVNRGRFAHRTETRREKTEAGLDCYGGGNCPARQ
jgi:hypothetical protein